MREEPIYDSIAELVEAVQEGNFDPEHIQIVVDNDYSEAFIDNPDNFDNNHPEAIIDDDFVDMQILARDEQLPRGTLRQVLDLFNFNVEKP